MKHILALFFSLTVVSVFAQKIYMRNDSIPITKDTITIKAGIHNGKIQWQKSLDNKSWIDLEGQNKDSIKVGSFNEAIYRAQISQGTCPPVFSDSVVITTPDTITKNFIIPDKAGLLLLSDSTRIAKGEYIYKRNETSDFETGKILIDEKSGGTIRKITDIVQSGDSILMKTEQANLGDLFRNTSFKLSTSMAYISENLKNANLLTLEEHLTDKDGFIHPLEVIDELANGVRVKSASAFGNNSRQGGTLYMYKDFSGLSLFDYHGTFSYKNENGEIISYSGNAKSYISQGYFSFDPEFKFECQFDRPGIDWKNLSISTGEVRTFKFYTDNSRIEFKKVVVNEWDVACTVGEEFTIVPKIINKNFKFIVGGVPVWIHFTIDLDCKVTAKLGTGTKNTIGYQNIDYLTLGASYENDVWSSIQNIQNDTQLILPESVNGKMELKAEIYPKIKIKMYDVFGPYLSVGPYLKYQFKESIQKNWDQSVNFGIDASVGVLAEILGKKVASFTPGPWNWYSKDLFNSPSKLSLISGNNQTGFIGDILNNPIVVQVINSENKPVSNCFVHFAPNLGTVMQPVVKTDSNGFAQTNWMLSSTEGEQSLKIYVLNGNDKEISNCSYLVKATGIVQSIILPSVSTNSIENITQTIATSGGNVTSDGGATVIARGVCWSTSQNPTIASSKTTDGGGTGSFTSSLNGLTSNTIYYVRAYATNSLGTAYGNQQSFTTSSPIISQPTVTTNSIADITQTTATSGGNVASDGGATVTTRGVCWSTSQNPTIAHNKTTNGTGVGSFTSSIVNLTANTTYYVRAFATNSQGTAYGNQQTFTTSVPENLTGTFIDSRDGHVYKWVKIGTQTWMAENLAYLPQVYPPSSGSITDPRYYVNGNSGTDLTLAKQSTTYLIYGVLYNLPAANVSCPPGWHLPTDAEWKQLEISLGMTQAEADKEGYRGTDQGTQLKATSGWNANGTGLNLMGGYRHNSGSFGAVGDYGMWWSSSEFGLGSDWIRILHWASPQIQRVGLLKESGISIRCIKD